MNEQVKEYIEKYPAEIAELFKALRQLIFDSTSAEITEMLWARLPSFYAGEAFVRLIPFKDHINIEARAALQHREALAAYPMTPKGMVQIRTNQQIPAALLKQIFAETLLGS